PPAGGLRHHDLHLRCGRSRGALHLRSRLSQRAHQNLQTGGEMTPQSRKQENATLLGDKRLTPTMSDSIACRYGLVTHVLSLTIEKRWRSELAGYAHAHDHDEVLDVATGTADVAIEFARYTPAKSIVGVDLSDGMLQVARKKIARLELEDRISLRIGDALHLPFADESFDIVTIAFGLRN